ncbi:hypothetical protein KW787_04170 [Candidatus Pacearchaeota archaeon]|nr:hypothetical protein [Candidatus Pacearchaeota archaeon]
MNGEVNQEKPKRHWALLILVFAILILAIVLGFLIFRNVSQKQQSSIFSFNSSSNISEYVANALSVEKEQRITQCNKIPNTMESARCKIQSVLALHDSSICMADFGDVTFTYYPHNSNTSLSLTAHDYCWLYETQKGNANYCNNIADSKAQSVCIAENKP